jgi:hypothetical protein
LAHPGRRRAASPGCSATGEPGSSSRSSAPLVRQGWQPRVSAETISTIVSCRNMLRACGEDLSGAWSPFTSGHVVGWRTAVIPLPSVRAAGRCRTDRTLGSGGMAGAVHWAEDSLAARGDSVLTAEARADRGADPCATPSTGARTCRRRTTRASASGPGFRSTPSSSAVRAAGVLEVEGRPGQSPRMGAGGGRRAQSAASTRPGGARRCLP